MKTKLAPGSLVRFVPEGHSLDQSFEAIVLEVIEGGARPLPDYLPQTVDLVILSVFIETEGDWETRYAYPREVRDR